MPLDPGDRVLYDRASSGPRARVQGVALHPLRVLGTRISVACLEAARR